KIGAPMHPELALGAVVDGKHPHVFFNEDIVHLVRPTPAFIDGETKRQLAEIERRKILYRDGRASADVKGRTVILIDDGIATGATVRAVLEALREAHTARPV